MHRGGVVQERPIRVSSVDYIPSLSTVVLHPTIPLSLSRASTSSSSTAPRRRASSNVNGRPLDGAGAGQPGSDFTTVLLGFDPVAFSVSLSHPRPPLPHPPGRRF